MNEIIKKICLIKLKLWQAILFLAVMSLALALFLFLLQPFSFSDVITSIIENRGLNLFLNWLPLFLLMLFLYFAGTGAATASTIVGALGVGLSFANRTKILYRGDPLIPWDLFLGGEVIGIIRSFGTGFIVLVAVSSVVFILAAVVLAFVIRSAKIDIRLRIAGVAACLLLAFLLNNPLYNNEGLHDRLYVTGSRYNQVNLFNSHGFMYSFIHAFNTNRVMRPEGYDREAVIEAIRRAETGGIERLSDGHPHIIKIMGEAFSEISMLPNFDFTGFTDPLENWREIITESIYGHIVVPALGGGTAQTEFDVLTGLSSRDFRGVPFAFRLITGEFESMASILNSIGFRSEFMHPGYGWFYNRQNVYRELGFERLVFIDEFEDVPTRGMYINEHDTINRVIEMFAEHRASRPNTPYFHFCVTIQNHGPYVDKFLDYEPVTVPNFTTDLDFSDADINALSNYFHGLKDADIELRRLVEYFRELREPVVLVYFGDHKPALNRRIYYTLFPGFYEPGSFEDLTRLYTVPFIIWLNDAAKALYDVRHPMDLAGEEELLFSSSFLGAYVLEILGITNISPFWDFNKQLRRLFPVVTEIRSFDPERNPSPLMSDERRAPLILYRHWSYFRIFDE